MVMLNTKLPIKWVMKYSKKPIFQMTPGTLAYYKWAQKIGRREFLKKSREKTATFEKKHPGNSYFRVFKTLYLRDKNVSNDLLMEFKMLIETKKGWKSNDKSNMKHLSLEKILEKLKK